MHHELNTQLAEQVKLCITIADDAKLGNDELRLGTPVGLTNPLIFQVGQYREQNETEPVNTIIAPSLRSVQGGPAPERLRPPRQFFGKKWGIHLSHVMASVRPRPACSIKFRFSFSGRSRVLRDAILDATVPRSYVDIILNRTDLERAVHALKKVGFIFRHAAQVTMFLDGAGAKARDAVHVVFAGEKVRDDYVSTVPSIDDYEEIQGSRTLPLEALVRMKLTSFRRKDQVHLLDMLSVGLIDESWLDRFPPALRPRLKELIDDPNG